MGLKFQGLVVEICTHLKQHKVAIKSENRLYVSPAVHSLLKGATPAEAALLKRHIKIIEVPNYSLSRYVDGSEDF